MYKIGLKLWSTNTSLMPEAGRLVDEGIYHYIELFSVPGSFRETTRFWKKLSVPFVIHAAHAMAGLNFAVKDGEASNRALAAEAFRFADELGADTVIFHTGLNGTIDETIRQIGKIPDSRKTVENKPYYGLNDEICIGSTAAEMRRVIDETGSKFCFDFGHAICAANAKSRAPLEFISEFLSLNPLLYHLTDGDFSAVYDQHEHYGEGDYPLRALLAMIPAGAMVTNEAKRKDEHTLSEAVADSKTLGRLAGPQRHA